MIYYNFASALFDDGQIEKADSALKKCLEINPDFDLALMFLGNIAKAQNRNQEAVEYYKNVIKVNRKYLEAYVELSGIIVKDDVVKARDLLVTCLNIDPRFKPAIMSMAETYRTSNPDVAKKYDELAKTIK
jgi:tetratricopeptide (TPR) repeat protein